MLLHQMQRLHRNNLMATFRLVSRQIKDFLLSEQSKEFFVFLFFFVVAAGFWLLQTLNQDYEAEFDIPVRLRNVPENVVVTANPPGEVRIKVKDKGTVLLNYMLARNFYPITLDFNVDRGNMGHVRILSSTFERHIEGQFNASTQLLSLKPDTLEYIYSTGIPKKVPVRLKGEVSAGREYYLSDTIFEPDSVVVYAPRQVLDTITSVYTNDVKAADIIDTLRMQVSLESKQGVKMVPARIGLVLPVDIFTEKTVEVPIHGINFPADRILRAFPSKVSVTFQVGLSRFRHIHADDFYLAVSYEELLKLGAAKYPVKLKRVPEGVSHVRCNPEQVDFLIEQVSQ